MDLLTKQSMLTGLSLPWQWSVIGWHLELKSRPWEPHSDTDILTFNGQSGYIPNWVTTGHLQLVILIDIFKSYKSADTVICARCNALYIIRTVSIWPQSDFLGRTLRDLKSPFVLIFKHLCTHFLLCILMISTSIINRQNTFSIIQMTSHKSLDK